MARGGPPGRGARGGDGIPALRPASARLILAAGAILAAAAVGASPVLAAAGWERLIGVLGVVGLLLLLVALVLGAAGAVPWAIAALGAEYATWLMLIRAGGVDDRAPLYAAGILLVGELAYWSLEHRGVETRETPLTLRRLLTVVAGAIASILLGAGLLAASAVEAGGGLVLEVVGVLGALGVLALIARVVWREREER